MVDCFDRIHLQLTEVVLRPLRALAGDAGKSSATVRLPGRDCRIDLTVTKHASSDGHAAAYYQWSAVAGDGTRTWSDNQHYDSPDAVYWSAVELIGASLR